MLAGFFEIGKNISGNISKSIYAHSNTKTKFIPKSDWLIIPNAHEPIITQEIYDNVQTILGPYNERTANRENTSVLARKLYCGHCGYALRRYEKSKSNSKYATRYVCRSSIVLGNGCCIPKPIMESYIFEVILEALRMEISLANKARQQFEKQGKLLMRENEKLSDEMKRLAIDIERLKSSREQLFEEYADRKLTKEQYIAAKSEIINSIKKAEETIQSIATKLSDQGQSLQQSTNYDMLAPYTEATEVTAEMMTLIKRINVFADNRFEIDYTFSR